MTAEFRTGSHEPRNVWHDPEGVNRPLVIPDEKTGVQICHARDEYWANQIVRALNRQQICGRTEQDTGYRCGLVAGHPGSGTGHHYLPPQYVENPQE